MPLNNHLSDKEKKVIIPRYRHGVSLKHIAGDINSHLSTVSSSLDRHKRGVRMSPLKNAKKLSDADVHSIMRRSRSGNFSAPKSNQA